MKVQYDTLMQSYAPKNDYAPTAVVRPARPPRPADLVCFCELGFANVYLNASSVKLFQVQA